MRDARSSVIILFLPVGLFSDMALRLSLRAIYMPLGTVCTVPGSAFVTPGTLLCVAALGLVSFVLLRRLPPSQRGRGKAAPPVLENVT